MATLTGRTGLRARCAAAMKTGSVFDRYNVINEADLAAAVGKRFNGKQTANTPPAEPTAESLSSFPA